MEIDYVAPACYISTLTLCYCCVSPQTKNKTAEKDFNKTVKFWREWATLFLWQEVSHQVFSTTIKLQEVFRIN